MAIANTAHGAATGSATAAATSGAITVSAAAGECIIVAVATVGTTSNPPTDNATGGSNTYVPLGSPATNTDTITLWGCLRSKSAVTAVTCTFGSSRWGVAISTFTGVVAFIFDNTNAATGTGTALTNTAPKALQIAGNSCIGGMAHVGVGTFSGTGICNSFPGPGSTSPGVAIFLSATTTVAGTNSGSTAWVEVVFELAASIFVVNNDEIVQNPMYRDWRLAYDHIAETDEPGFVGVPPLAHIPDDLSKFDATGWRAFQLVDEESDKSVVPPAPIINLAEPDDIQKFVGTIAIYDHTADTDEPGGLPVPPFSEPARFALAADEIIVGGVSDWMVPLPPVTSDESDFYRQPVIDWRAFQHDDTDTPQFEDTDLLAPTTQTPDDLIKFDATWRANQLDDSLLEYSTPVTPIVVVPNIGLDEDQYQFKPIEFWDKFQNKSDLDEPGQLGAPAVAIQDDESPRFVGTTSLYDYISDTDEPGGLAVPPSAILDESADRWTGWFAAFYDDTLTESDSPVTPPTVGSDDDQKALLPAIQFDEALASEKTPPAPIVISTATDDLEAITTMYGPRALQPDDDYRALPPTPPVTIQEEPIEKQVDWFARQYEDTDTANAEDNDFLAPTAFQEEPIEKYVGWLALQHEDLETRSSPAPTPPFVQQVEESEQKNVSWQALHEEGVESGKTPPPPPASTNVGIDDSESTQHAMDRISIYHEEDNQNIPPPPPASIQEEPIEKYIGWLALQYEDVDTALTTTPPPPTVIQEEPIEKNVDTRQLQYEDPETQRALPPTPPVSIQFEESEQKNIDWQVKQQEDTETQSASAVTPPIVQQFEESEQKNVDWKSLHEDGVESGKTPPPPPPAINQGWDDLELSVHAQDAILRYHEDDLQTLPPPPPPALQDEISERTLPLPSLQPEDDAWVLPPTPPVGQADIFTEQWVDWRQQLIEDDRSSGAPAPPFALQDQVDDSMWRGLSSPIIEDDWSATAPTPPFALQDQADDTLWRGIQTPLIEDDLTTRAPTPPFAVQDLEDSLWRGWTMPLVEDDWLMGTPAPPTVEQDEISERLLPLTVQFDEVLAAEKTPPPVIPPNSSDDIEAHFRTNIPALQPEDDARILPPTPPVTQQFEESEQKNVDYVARQFEDTETQRALPPTPPLSIQFEESEQKNVDYLARQYEDTETQQAAAAPPPVTQIDEISERFVDWSQSWHEDVETQRTLPPTPPTADDFDHSQMLQYVPMAIPFDEADAREFPPPPPPLVVGAGRDDEELQMYREFAGPYYEAIQEQWIWFSGFIYPTGVLGSGNIQKTIGTGSLLEVMGSGQAEIVEGTGQTTDVEGTGQVKPITGDGKVN